MLMLLVQGQHSEDPHPLNSLGCDGPLHLTEEEIVAQKCQVNSQDYPAG